MTEKVKKILSFYDSEPPGVVAHLARILNHGSLGGTGKLLILPVDQGFEHGPIVSFGLGDNVTDPFIANTPYDPYYHFRLAIAGGCSAYSAPLGFLRAGAREFAGQIPLILKLNSSDSLYKNPQSPIPALTAKVDSALELGCSAVGFTIYPASEERKQMYEEVAKVSEYARKHGLAVVIWAYPRGKGVSKEGETALDVVSYSAHISAQLGAHIIKVKPPTDYIESAQVKKLFATHNIKTNKLSDRVRYVLRSAFNGKRIVIFSGGPTQEKTLFLEGIKGLAHGGAFGSIVGRNVFKRPFNEALDLLKEIVNIYKNN